MSDAVMAALARQYAEALGVWARDRTADAKLRLASVQTELCAAYRKEQEDQFAALADASVDDAD